MLFTNTVFNATVLRTTSMLQLLLFPRSDTRIQQDRQCMCQQNIEVCSHNHCCHGKAMTHNAQCGHAIQEHQVEIQ